LREVKALLKGAKVPYIRTGSRNQSNIAARFGLTVAPAADFVVICDIATLAVTWTSADSAVDGSQRPHNWSDLGAHTRRSPAGFVAPAQDC
jgi:hypothetical protein